MNVSVERLSGVEIKITVEVPVEKVRESYEGLARELARRANVPGGYKKHAAKLARVKQLYRKHILADLAASVVEDTLSAAIRENEIKVLGTPRVADLPAATLEGPYTYSVNAETYPEIPDVQYKGLVNPVVSTEVTDEDVDKALETVVRGFSRMEDYNGDTVQDEAYLGIDITVEGESPEVTEKLTRDGYFIKVNDDLSEGLRKALTGHTIADPLTFHGSAVDVFGYTPDGTADKTFQFSMKIKQARAFVKPVVDDEFAQKARGVSSVLALRGLLREELAEEKKKEGESQALSLVRTQLIQKNPIDLPKEFVTQVVRDRMESFMKGMEQYRKALDPETLERYFRERHQQEVFRSTEEALIFFLAGAVADKEEISVSDEDVDARIRKMAEAEKVDQSLIRSRLGEDLDMLKADIRQEKALERVRELGEPRPMAAYLAELEAQHKADQEARQKEAQEAPAQAAQD
jgi:trigger factor